jgi:hypothetical protein
MPLFAGIIEFNDETFEIPVFAQDAEEALLYLASENDWVEDGAFYVSINMVFGQDKNVPFVVSGVVAITDPRQSPFSGDTVCWHKECQIDEIFAGTAFYDSELQVAEAEVSAQVKQLEDAGPKVVCLDEAITGVWDAYLTLEQQLVERFDDIRYCGIELEQALAIGCGSARGEAVDPEIMHAVARVLANEVEELRWKLAMIDTNVSLPAEEKAEQPTLN